MTHLNFRDRFLRGLTNSDPSNKSRFFFFAFTAMFFGGGLLIASQWVFAFGDFFRMQNWEQVDARVTSSELSRSESSDSSDSVKIHIGYDYHFRGQHYSGDRYDIGSTYTNMGVGRMKEIVNRHQEGTPIVVSVNPEKPAESIISPELSPQIWIMIPFSAPFLLVGILGTGYGLTAGWFSRRSRQLKMDLAPEAPSPIREVLEKEYLLPRSKLLFSGMQNYYDGIILLCVSIFWNGIVTVFLVATGQMLYWGEREGILIALFLIPFVLVGGWMIFLTLRSFTGPKPPSWLFLADGVLPDSDGGVKLSWMPLKDDRQDFRSCSLNVVRWGSGLNFRKWKKKNPEWREGLVPMKKNTPGEHEFIVSEQSEKIWILPVGMELHLVMAWTARDGRKHENSWQLSPTRDDG